MKICVFNHVLPPAECSANSRYLRRFRADTVVGRSTAALRCALDFFGLDHVVFATGFPFGPEKRMRFLRENMRPVEDIEVDRAGHGGIYFGNALKLLRPAR